MESSESVLNEAGLCIQLDDTLQHIATPITQDFEEAPSPDQCFVESS